MRTKSSSRYLGNLIGLATLSLFAGVGLIFINALLGAFLWPYVFNSWLEFFHKPYVVLWWHGALIGIIPWVRTTVLPAAFLTWIGMLIVQA